MEMVYFAPFRLLYYYKTVQWILVYVWQLFTENIQKVIEDIVFHVTKMEVSVHKIYANYYYNRLNFLSAYRRIYTLFGISMQLKHFLFICSILVLYSVYMLITTSLSNFILYTFGLTFHPIGRTFQCLYTGFWL